MLRQYTATVYILHEDRVLLILHRKFNKWLPPGGHIDENETPPEAVKREALEETGLEISLIRQENIWVSRWNAVSIERPWMMLLENIPSTSTQEAHQHIDLIYVARPAGGQLEHNQRETNGLRWFSLEEVMALKSDQEIFLETQETIQQLLKQGIRE